MVGEDWLRHCQMQAGLRQTAHHHTEGVLWSDGISRTRTRAEVGRPVSGEAAAVVQVDKHGGLN